MKEIIIPDKILEQLKMVGEEKNCGMLLLAIHGATLILISDRELGVNRSAILAASVLLNGVVNDMWEEANEELNAKEKKQGVH